MFLTTSRLVLYYDGLCRIILVIKQMNTTACVHGEIYIMECLKMGLKATMIRGKLLRTADVMGLLRDIDDIVLLSDIRKADFDLAHINVLHAINNRAIELIRQVKDKQTLDKLENQCKGSFFSTMFYAQALEIDGALCKEILGLVGGHRDYIPFLSKAEDFKKVIQKYGGTEAGILAANILAERTDSV